MKRSVAPYLRAATNDDYLITVCKQCFDGNRTMDAERGARRVSEEPFTEWREDSPLPRHRKPRKLEGRQLLSAVIRVTRSSSWPEAGKRIGRQPRTARRVLEGWAERGSGDISVDLSMAELGRQDTLKRLKGAVDERQRAFLQEIGEILRAALKGFRAEVEMMRRVAMRTAGALEEDIENAEIYYGNRGELQRHLNGVQCHICGEFFKSLGHHVSRAHKLKPREYRTRYGIPAGTSLTSKQYAAACRARNHRLGLAKRVSEYRYQAGVKRAGKDTYRCRRCGRREDVSLGNPVGRVCYRCAYKQIKTELAPRRVGNGVDLSRGAGKRMRTLP